MALCTESCKNFTKTKWYIEAFTIFTRCTCSQNAGRKTGVHDTRMCVLFILVLHLSQRRSQDVGLLPTRSKHRCWRLSIVIDTKFHGVTAGLLDQVPEIRFNHRCNGNIEKGRKVSERQPENWWAAFSKEVVSPCRCFTTRNYISLITSYELCSYHEYSWIILRIHQNEWITRIWCLDSPGCFWGTSRSKLYHRKISIHIIYTCMMRCHNIRLAQPCVFWHGRVATKTAVQGPAD